MKFSLKAYLELKSAIEELIEKAESGAVILVEGRRDILALRKLGVFGCVIAVANKSNVELVDSIGCREVVILTDWDDRGEKLKEDLVVKLSSWGVVADTSIRKKIFSAVGKNITEVEDLAEFVRRCEEGLIKLIC